MKKSFLVIATLLMSASNSFAVCYNFINGKGPSKIGNSELAAVATKVCIKNVNAIGGRKYSTIEFSDNLSAQQGALAIVTSEDNSESVIFNLGTGNAGGVGVDFRGTKITLKLKEDLHLNVVTGILSIQEGRDFEQRFLVMKAQ